MSTRVTLAAARKSLEIPIDFGTWSAALGSRDRVNIERHLAAVEAAVPNGAAHGKLWRRVARTLATLAPFAATTTGQQAVSFFVADGKYRMQVFALEDNRDGKICAYCVDVLDAAIETKILEKAKGEDVALHPIVDGGGRTLSVERLSAANTPNPSSYFKHMLGWNRKALRVTVTEEAGDAELGAMELLLALAAASAIKSAGAKSPTNTPGGAGIAAPAVAAAGAGPARPAAAGRSKSTKAAT